MICSINCNLYYLFIHLIYIFNAFNKAIEIKIAPIISVNQCTPEINLPITITNIDNIEIIFSTLKKFLFLNNYLLIIKELPQIHTDNNVCEDG